ncbi:MAG: aminotransferase class I/II-fold pyridoxal phosphate-dependent enzyme [Cytophagales bacterium]|nr:MAG: aminotransferase class I/II-fold pyridoxal phosphate-dependent enzyme [Cytophagales bacterium]
MTNIQKAFSVDLFREQAHQMVDLLADYLSSSQNRETPTILFQTPEDNLAFWEADFAEGVNENPADFFKKVIDKSTHLHNPRYMGHQVGVIAPIAAMTSMLSALLNNGMAVYEMGLVSNPLEKIVTDLMAKRIGFDEKSGGILTSGGTLANLTSLLAARAKYAPTDVWQEGNNIKLAVMVSEEAHYCIDRAARIMGMGSEGIIKISTNEAFQMQTELLEKYYQEATKKGFCVIAVIGSSCSTSTGSYDNLKEIGKFAKEKNIWFHVDGAHGGASIFSEKYKHKVQGIEMADSVVIDWHKMLLTPALVTALIFKDNQDSYQTFQQKAQYLWVNQTSQDWFNSGKRTFECTKLMMSVKVYSILKTYGEKVLTENIDYLYDLGKQFATIIEEHPKFELGVNPECNIVCFRVKDKDDAEIQSIRQKLLEKGKFYIVQTILRERTYLRISLMNPLTTLQDLKDLLEEILEIIVRPS